MAGIVILFGCLLCIGVAGLIVFIVLYIYGMIKQKEYEKNNPSPFRIRAIPTGVLHINTKASNPFLVKQDIKDNK